jgi:hypothetical protein
VERSSFLSTRPKDVERRELLNPALVEKREVLSPTVVETKEEVRDNEDIYPADPNPAVVETSCEVDTYPNEPRPITVD